jgi:hypothetical protein
LALALGETFTPIEAMRAFPRDVAANAQPSEPTLARPVLGSVQEDFANTAAARAFVDDESGEFAERMFFQVQAHGHVRPADDKTIGSHGNEYLTAAYVSAQLRKSPTDYSGIIRITQLRGQLRDGRGVFAARRPRFQSVRSAQQQLSP